MPPKRVSPRGQAATRPAVEEEPVVPKKPARKRTKAADKKDGYAIRNIRNVIVRITLDDFRIELLPRGQRGDLAFVTEDQMNDPWFAPNVGMIYEVITRDGARDIIEKQSTNQQVGPTLADQLLNEKGEHYTQAPSMAPSNEQQAITVAQVHQGDAVAHQQQTEQLTRQPGSPPPISSPPGAIGNAMTEAQVDAIARSATGEDAGNLLRDAVQVRVEPPQQG